CAGRSITVVEDESKRLFGSKLFQINDVDWVIFLNLIVVRFIGKRKGQHALLFRIRLVDTGEGSRENYSCAQVTWLHGGVFAGRTFTIVMITDNNGRYTGGLVSALSGGYRTIFA